MKRPPLAGVFLCRVPELPPDPSQCCCERLAASWTEQEDVCHGHPARARAASQLLGSSGLFLRLPAVLLCSRSLGGARNCALAAAILRRDCPADRDRAARLACP